MPILIPQFPQIKDFEVFLRDMQRMDAIKVSEKVKNQDNIRTTDSDPIISTPIRPFKSKI